MSVAELEDEALFDLSDEELEAAFKEAKTQDTEDGPSSDEEVQSEEEEMEEESIDEIDEEEVDEVEQPEDQDSDDDTSDDDEEEEESDEDSEDEDSEPDEDLDPEDENPEEEEEESKEPEQPVQNETLTFKANGQEYTFTTDEMKSQFGKVFGQAMDYTKKMQQIKPWRKTIDAIEQAELSNDDVNLMIDVLKGDKDAIATVLKRTGTDALDLDVENTNYVTKDYGRDDTELAISDIVDRIKDDAEYVTTHKILEKSWDDASRDAFIQDPEMIALLHNDVKSGMFDEINPIAQKLKVYDNARRSDLDYYKESAKQYFANQAQQMAQVEAENQRKAESERKAAEEAKLQETKAKQAKRKATKQASTKRKAAAPAKKASGTKKVTDYLDDSDEAFDEWYNKLQDSL